MPALALASAWLLLAHNPDTSYARVEVAADAVRTRLTYDVFTLLSITPLDDNRDGQLARGELTRHLPQIDAFLRDHVWLTIGEADETEELGALAGFVWPPDTGDAIPEADYHAATGLIHFDFVRPVDEVPEQVALTFGFFEQFGERHTVLGAFAAGGTEYEVTFDRYAPDFTYVTGMEPPLGQRLWRFFKLGVEHIFLGYDHICFLIALIVVSSFRDVVKVVTSFTIAHSITLILATLEVVQLPGRWVEICIAGTIVYVALENLWIRDTRHRWWLTFFFGLVHGFGFAGVLRELGLPSTGLVRCLLMFNLGVEVGQLAIALALLPLAMALQRWKHGRIAQVVISLLLAAFGTGWLIDRLFNLEWMPF